jgi:5-amino-6-(5-phosphoribosylamino)uracil reductase
VRASCDAIMVGAATVRIDNPRLLVRSQTRREARTARGLPPSPIKVTVTDRVELDAHADFFTTGETDKLVYCTSPRVREARSRLGPVATVVDGGQPVEMRTVSEDLGARGVQRLMVEGGGRVHTQFLTDNLADELQLVVAPFFVGDSRATRFVSDGHFPWNPDRRARLAEVRQIGDVVLLRYALSPRFGSE